MRAWSLTGNIACGKSAVEAILRAHGAFVVDADTVAREVVAAGQPALGEIAAEFGATVLTADGSLDRPALGAVVFADPQARRRLEAITHPRIFEATAAHLARAAAAGSALAVVSAALAVETGSYRTYDGLLVVTCPPALQLARLLARDGNDEQQARARIASQLPQERKAALADAVFDNSGTPAQLEVQVLGWLMEQLPAERGPGAG